jgi:hypothetical protein
VRPMNDNDPSELAECELPEWFQARQDEARERESEDRFKIGVAVLVIMVTGLMAMQWIATYPGGLG